MLGVNPNSKREENDYYATNPKALQLFLDEFTELDKYVWECACGEGHLSEELLNQDYKVFSTDLIDRNYINFNKKLDFLSSNNKFCGDILTNPPFKLAEEFVKKGHELIDNGNKIILFLKIQFLEGQKRKEMFKKYPLKYVYVHSSRQQCSMNADFENLKATTQFYAWYVWEKGYKGDTIIKWLQKRVQFVQVKKMSEEIVQGICTNPKHIWYKEKNELASCPYCTEKIQEFGR